MVIENVFAKFYGKCHYHFGVACYFATKFLLCLANGFLSNKSPIDHVVVSSGNKKQRRSINKDKESFNEAKNSFQKKRFPLLENNQFMKNADTKLSNENWSRDSHKAKNCHCQRRKHNTLRARGCKRYNGYRESKANRILVAHHWGSRLVDLPIFHRKQCWRPSTAVEIPALRLTEHVGSKKNCTGKISEICQPSGAKLLFDDSKGLEAKPACARKAPDGNVSQ